MPRAKKREGRSSSPNDAATKPVSSKGGAWSFPRHSLERAIEIIKIIEDKNAGKPMPSTDIAKQLGFNQPDWRYLGLLRSAHLYGLVSESSATRPIGLTPLANDVIAPSTPSQRAAALRKAFGNVSDFNSVQLNYGGKKLPDDDYFLNTLTREFNIPRERVNAFSDVFKENLRFLAQFSNKPGASTEDPEGQPIVDDRPQIPNQGRSREHLNTCFVMMPFGSWYDKYYEKIYVPAIKDAGLEPVRADELYSSGSVVDQIWEQIGKAKVLLAELTGRNANVFYELGLAHAACKPVVFTASPIEDVPFDLRHLRVIAYDTRDPDWSAYLRRSVTEHLRDALRFPSKSIPGAFRRPENSEDSSEENSIE